MAMSLREKFNRLAKAVSYQDELGMNIVKGLTTEQDQAKFIEVMEKSSAAYDFQTASKIMSAAYNIAQNPPQDDTGFESGIQVYKKLLEMGDANIGLMAEVIGEEKVKEALPEKNKDVAKGVAQSLRLKNMQKLLR